MITTANGLKVSVAVLGAAALLASSVAYASGGTWDGSAYTTNTSVSLSATPQRAINSQIGVVTFTGVDNVLTGSGNDSIGGNSNDNVINSGSGNDMILAGDGNDTLNGGTGTDRLTGGAGNDTLVFDPNFGTDTVVDFNAGDATNHDTLDLSALGFASVQDVLDAMTNVSSNVVKLTVGSNSITFLYSQKADFENNPATIQI